LENNSNILTLYSFDKDYRKALFHIERRDNSFKKHLDNSDVDELRNTALLNY